MEEGEDDDEEPYLGREVGVRCRNGDIVRVIDADLHTRHVRTIWHRHVEME